YRLPTVFISTMWKHRALARKPEHSRSSNKYGLRSIRKDGSALMWLRAVIIVLACGLIPLTDGHAQVVKKLGTSAATFLRIPVGARGSALGSAYVSRSEDATTLFWNPSGLSRLSGTSITLDYAPWLPGLDFSYAGLAIPMGNLGGIGLSVTSLNSEKMDVTTPQYPMGTGETFTAASLALGFTYARNLTDRFSIGVTVKYIQERIYHSYANGIGFDIGTLFNIPFRGIRLGISVANFGSKMQMDGEDLNVRVDIAPDQKGNNQTIVGALRTDKFDIPLIMRIGLSGELVESDQMRITWVMDGINPNDNTISLNLGLECALWRESVVLRAGYNNLLLEDNIRGFTAGAGLSIPWAQVRGMSIDYAFQDFQYLGGVNRFSVSAGF
ncbi:MAG: PorV/PorQ family protein, partial [Fidelibacterota bacterium]